MKITDYLSAKPVLETERLVLRQLTADDAADLEEWLPDPDLYKYWGRPASKVERNPRKQFADPKPHIVKKPRPALKWGLALKPHDKIIGEIYLMDIENDSKAKVAFRLSKEYWGRGLATEALKEVVRFCFEDAELERLWTDVDARNAASRAVLEKCGLKKEGFIRQGRINLTFYYYYMYGMFKRDFKPS